MALEIVTQAREQGVRFEWVGVDAHYGMSLKLLDALDAAQEVFLADIHKDRHILLGRL